MTNAPTRNSSEGALDKREYKPGRLLKVSNSVRAATLAALLQGRVLTGMDSVYANSTTRLSAVIHALTRLYDWTIQRRTVDIGTKDARVAAVTEYRLAPQAIARAVEELNAEQWVANVLTVQAKSRRHAAKAKAHAATANARRAVELRQWRAA